MQQLSGVKLVFYYAAKVFAQNGRTGANAAPLANGNSSSLLPAATASLEIMTDLSRQIHASISRAPVYLLWDLF